MVYTARSVPVPGDDPLYILSVPDIKRAGDRDISEGKKDRIGFCYGTRGEGSAGKSTMCVYLLILLAGMLLVDWKLGLLVYGIAILVYVLYYRNAMKYFGGTTGDLAGCFFVAV